jgi:PKD domain
MCTVRIRSVVGVDTDGDGRRDQIIIVGTVQDCSGLQVALDGVSRVATLLAPGVGAHGVSPVGSERVFTVTFTLNDTTIFKGLCGTVAAGSGLGLLAVCNADSQCRDAVLWDRPINCDTSACPVVTVSVDPSDACNGERRGVSLSVVVNPYAPGLVAEVNFGDGQSEQVTVSSVDLGDGLVIGQSAVFHTYSVPGSGPTGGSTTFLVTVTIAGRRDCITTVSLDLANCPPPPNGCPVDQIALRVLDASGTDVTSRVEAGDCLPPGVYRLRAEIVPPGSTSAFSWRVDGVAAAVGQRDVVAVNGPQLTLSPTAFRSVSVIAAACASDGIDLRPCEPACCPELTDLTASCLSRCPPSTTSTFNALGTDIDCADSFSWEFGDGTTAETTTPGTTHAYPRLGRFNATVTIVRPEECGGPRTQRRTAAVVPCALSAWCRFLAIASGMLLLAFLVLMPLVACASDPATKQVLIITMGVVVILLAVAIAWWFLDPCCRPTRCELLRIFFWAFSWALLALGLIVVFCPSLLIPFGVAYLIAQQIFLRMINDEGCASAPDILIWPFPT